MPLSRIERFIQPLDGIVVVSRATTRANLTPDAIAAGRARVAAGESIEDVAADLAAQDRALRRGPTHLYDDFALSGDRAAALKAWEIRGRGHASAGDELRAIMTERIGEAQGSNPGGSYRAADGSVWYVKQYRDPTQAYGEQAANELYHALGLGGSRSVVGEIDGRTMYARQWMEGETLANVELTHDVANRIIDGFAADAFTGNWDAVGTDFDNVLVHHDGSVSRIDNGGTFLHRAQGSLKDQKFLPTVGEWNTLTDRAKAPYYSQVFRAAGYKKADDLGERAVHQIDRILAVRKQHGGWASFVDRAIGQAPADYRKALADTLESRTADLERIRQRLTGVRHHLSVDLDSAAAHKAWDTRGRGRTDDTADSPSDPRTFRTWEHLEEQQPRPTAIYVKRAKDAIPLILAGKVVELKNPRKVNTVLVKLAQIAADAEARGEAAPHYDLCKITVKGASFFCESRVRTKEYPNGIPRIAMPQLGGEPVPGTAADRIARDDRGLIDGGPEFLDHLRRSGITTTSDEVPAASLIASQAELIGAKVARRVVKKGWQPNPIFVSRDNYIIDGHHRWAAQVARDAADNKLGDLKIRVIRVDAPITEILPRAVKWSKRFGIKQASVHAQHLQDDSLFAVPDDAEHSGLLVSVRLTPEAAKSIYDSVENAAPARQITSSLTDDDSRTGELVDPAVRSRRLDLEIVLPVIRSIPVSVVDMLGGEERATDLLLHHQTMLSDLFTGALGVDVATFALATKSAIAISRAKLRTGGLWSPEYDAALSAFDSYLSECASRFPPSTNARTKALMLPAKKGRLAELASFGESHVIPLDEYHCTLCYCGPVDELGDVTVARAIVAVDQVCQQAAPLTGETAGLGRFDATEFSDGKDVIIAEVSVPGLAELRQQLFSALVDAGAPPRTNFEWHPHITLAYVPVGAPAPLERLPAVPLTFDAVTISVGDLAASIPLGAAVRELHDWLAQLVVHRQRVGDTRQRVGGVPGVPVVPEGWQLLPEGLVKRFEFPNRRACAVFTAALMEEANRANHHPDIAVAENGVTVTFITHATNSVTNKDYAGAAFADSIESEAMQVLSATVDLDSMSAKKAWDTRGRSRKSASSLKTWGSAWADDPDLRAQADTLQDVLRGYPSDREHAVAMVNGRPTNVSKGSKSGVRFSMEAIDAAFDLQDVVMLHSHPVLKSFSATDFGIADAGATGLILDAVITPDGTRFEMRAKLRRSLGNLNSELFNDASYAAEFISTPEIDRTSKSIAAWERAVTAAGGRASPGVAKILDAHIQHLVMVAMAKRNLLQYRVRPSASAEAQWQKELANPDVAKRLARAAKTLGINVSDAY